MASQVEPNEALSARQETPREEARRKAKAWFLDRVEGAECVVDAASAALKTARDELDDVSGKTSLFAELMLVRSKARTTFYETLLAWHEQR